MKNIFTLSLFSILVACQISTKHENNLHTPVLGDNSSVAKPADQAPVTQNQETAKAASNEQAAQAMAMGSTPKIALILGPGAIRAYGHVGVVQEFAKLKIPIQSIVGFEMGALVAAIYANKGQPYDVEWQMMKLKESDILQKGLLSGETKSGDVKSLNEFLNLSLSSARAENAKVPFACPAYQMAKQQIYMMNRGAFTQMLPFCMAFPPLFKPYQQNVAGVLDMKTAIDYVRSHGATYVIYVDLLSGPVKLNSTEAEAQVLWSLSAEALSKQDKGLDYVIHVPLQDYDLLDFDHRREMIQKGQQAGQEAATVIMKKLGL